jgi:RNA polymerase sigma factor (sigma-70 family)
MDDRELLARRFEDQRSHLRAVAYRMLGSPAEADDAVQETWLRLSRAETTGIESLDGWLTTVVARVCLGMLRSRRSRREEPLDTVAARAGDAHGVTDPETEALISDSIGVALLVVLDTLTPTERIALVLHDMFGVPFDEIAPILGRSSEATRQLASRARRRVRGTAPPQSVDIGRQRTVVEAFLAASRRADFDALLAVLDPDIVLRTDGTVGAGGEAREVRGAVAVAEGTLAYSGLADFADSALVNGSVGIVGRRGGLLVVIQLTIAADRITQIEIIGDPVRTNELDLAVLDS